MAKIDTNDYFHKCFAGDNESPAEYEFNEEAFICDFKEAIFDELKEFTFDEICEGMKIWLNKLEVFEVNDESKFCTFMYVDELITDLVYDDNELDLISYFNEIMQDYIAKHKTEKAA
ncbi:Uncharacterised protein [Campylobacter hyointestinalis subsp. hyointestinalis]|uniref:Uncharacterized protein n=1 Tax=Campylobacter hyointestinalis subsp. hyointestinalis TaxID=91352 RepID=A0A0S4SVF7_CAMHY|nr:hypothetical protein [Campylobacter hyointestinalis]CUU89719.1 Uncharacterised protein [Campylobacter hyointestinalis subsp. hyointestinalis]